MDPEKNSMRELSADERETQEIISSLPDHYAAVADLATRMGFDSADANTEREFTGHSTNGEFKVRVNQSEQGKVWYTIELTVDPAEYPGLKSVSWSIDSGEDAINSSSVGYSADLNHPQDEQDSFMRVLRDVNVADVISSA